MNILKHFPMLIMVPLLSAFPFPVIILHMLCSIFLCVLTWLQIGAVIAYVMVENGVS